MEERIRELLKSATQESYKLYSSEHPYGIYLGLNSLGQKSLVVILDAVREKTDSSKIIDVRYVKRDNGELALTFSLQDDTYVDMFYLFCEDIISHTSSSSDNKTFVPVVERWNTWREFFKRNNVILSEKEIMGLLGELYFLDQCMIPKYGTDKAIDSYIGANKSHKDFEVGEIWYEVKTIKNGTTSVKISSIEQLESDRIGYLEVFTLDDGVFNTESELSLNKIVNDIMVKLNPIQKNRLNDKLMKVGYIPNEKYDEYSYILIRSMYYEVKEGFPRIDRKQLPNGVSKVKYDIDISALKTYEVKEWT